MIELTVKFVNKGENAGFTPEQAGVHVNDGVAHILVIEGGMQSGKPSVAINLQMPEGGRHDVRNFCCPVLGRCPHHRCKVPLLMSSELADRCEAASGADRELDALIWCHINGKRYCGHNPAYGEPRLTQVEYTEPPKRTRLVTGLRSGLPHALPVTASIDAALTLVPEGHDWSLDNFDGEMGKPHAWVCKHGPFHNGTATTPALAICAAALRAKEHTND